MRYWLACKILLIIVGLIWCKEAFSQRHNDIAAVRQSKDIAERNMVIVYWIGTSVIVFLLATSGVDVVLEFFRLLQSAVR